MPNKPSNSYKLSVRLLIVVILIVIGTGAVAINKLHPDYTGYPIVVDNCDPDPSIIYVDRAVADECTTTIIRTWQASDACGNTAETVQKITITDTTPPVIQCPQDRIIKCDGYISPSFTVYARAEDNCDPSPSITYVDRKEIKVCGSIIRRTWIATDACGNSVQCVQKIKLVDYIPPAIRCPPDVTISCDGSRDPLYTGYPIVMDNCDPNPLVTYRDVVGLSGCHGYITRTWQATDACGNTRYCMQRITVIDTTPPVFDINPWVNRECDAMPDDIPDCDCY